MEIKNYNVRELTLNESVDVNGGGPLWEFVKKYGFWGAAAWVTSEVIDNWTDIKDGAVGGWNAAMAEE
jgi:hypothetical protein